MPSAVAILLNLECSVLRVFCNVTPLPSPPLPSPPLPSPPLPPSGMYIESEEGKLHALKADHDVLNLKENTVVLVEIKD